MKRKEHKSSGLWRRFVGLLGSSREQKPVSVDTLSYDILEATLEERLGSLEYLDEIFFEEPHIDITLSFICPDDTANLKELGIESPTTLDWRVWITFDIPDKQVYLTHIEWAEHDCSDTWNEWCGALIANGDCIDEPHIPQVVFDETRSAWESVILPSVSCGFVTSI